MKRIFAFLLFLSVFCFCTVHAAEPAESDLTEVVGVSAAPDLGISAKSCLLMEYETGSVLYEQNADEPLPPASVTKIMSLLLVYEALDAGKIRKEDIISVSDTASAKGGSQVYLAPGERMSVDELIKCVAVASANDAVTALAEAVSGSEESFVKRMNERAAELNMKSAVFLNCTGLDDEGSNTVSARDVAVMSRALMAHEDIFRYTTIWTDSIRDGAFGLSNTNKLVRFYSGTNGLKTGSTSGAGFCISATAKRDGMQLIAVIMGSESSDIRNAQAKKLLDFGFAEFAVAHPAPPEEIGSVPVHKGQSETIVPVMREENTALLVGKGEKGSVETKVLLADEVEAPVERGQTLGRVDYYLGGELLQSVPLVAPDAVARVTFVFQFSKIWQALFL